MCSGWFGLAIHFAFFKKRKFTAFAIDLQREKTKQKIYYRIVGKKYGIKDDIITRT